VLLIMFGLLFGWFFPVLFLLPSIHAVVAVHMRREDRRHRELVDAIERHGPPPWWVR
jgi:cytochrome c-type biogenesis protein CcmH/NrfF